MAQICYFWDFLQGNAAISKELQSPRFQAIMRATSGRKKRTPDLKSFSHELSAKGVRPLPFWKSRGFGRVEVSHCSYSLVMFL